MRTTATPPRTLAEHDHTRTDQISQVRRWQIVAVVPELRASADRLQRLINLVAIVQQLGLTPGLAGVAKNVDEILSRSRG
jgi:hypothetical protein